MTEFQWLTISGAAKYLKTHRPAIYKLIKSRLLPEPVESGGQKLLQTSDLDKVRPYLPVPKRRGKK